MTNGSNLATLGDPSAGACPSCGQALPDSHTACSTCVQSDDDWARIQETLLPRLGNRYRLKGRLGSGAFGEVYRANDTMLDRDVAIKRVRLDTLKDPNQREQMRIRTVREAKTAAKLKHPHIVTVHDIIETPETSFIVMEFIDGPTLQSVLKTKGRLTLDETISILGPTAEALDCAHDNGVVHRDVKTANIMIQGTTDVKITDFGIAKSEASTRLTVAGSILGTPNYMSPEQARGDMNVDGRSDLFAFGCVLFECLTGQPAFRGENLTATLMAIVSKDPTEVDFESLGIHSDIGSIFKRALDKEPSKRFPSATALIDAVRALPEVEPPSDTTASVASPPAAPVVTRRDPGNTPAFDIRLTGDLKDTSTANLIREVYRARSTGILHLSQEKVEKRIYFKAGNVVFANSDLESDRLGEFLIANGELDRSTFDLASQTMQQTRQRLGRTLLELGVLNRMQLEDAVCRQIEAIIHSVICWESGAYGFEFLKRPVEDDIVLDLSTADLILGGLRNISSVDRLKNFVVDFDRVVVPSDNPLFLYQQMTLTASEGYLFSRVDGCTTVNDILSISPLGEQETLRCLYALVAAGVVELGEKGAREGLPRQETTETTHEASNVEVPDDDVPQSNDEAEQEVDDNVALILEDIAAKHASLETADLYDLLSVHRGASDDEIKRAYYAMAKAYHPDRHHRPALRQAQPLLEELFGKITEAYKTLSDSGSRRRYDGDVQIRERTQETCYEAKRSEPEHATIPQEVIASRLYQQGKKHFDQMEYFDAIQCLRDSVRISPETTSYRKLLAACLAKNPKWRREAESHFREVLKADMFDIECRCLLAEMYEDSNLTGKANAEYEAILAQDPDNTIAKQKLCNKEATQPRSKFDRLINVLTRTAD